MALTMVDKLAESSDNSAWPPEITAEFEREKRSPNPCVGSELVSESDRVRVWMIRLQPGERIGFHRHVLDYFFRERRPRAPARARRHHCRIQLRAG